MARSGLPACAWTLRVPPGTARDAGCNRSFALALCARVSLGARDLATSWRPLRRLVRRVPSTDQQPGAQTRAWRRSGRAAWRCGAGRRARSRPSAVSPTQRWPPSRPLRGAWCGRACWMCPRSSCLAGVRALWTRHPSVRRGEERHCAAGLGGRCVSLLSQLKRSSSVLGSQPAQPSQSQCL